MPQGLAERYFEVEQAVDDVAWGKAALLEPRSNTDEGT